MASIRTALAAISLAFLPSIALAGDIAAFNPIGFSSDGRHFGFEQSGIQDGSGFPYSEIVIVDLKNDVFAGGTPIEKRIDDENATLAQVRKQAYEAARPAIEKLGLDADPGMILAYNGPAEVTEDFQSLAFSPFAHLPRSSTVYRLTLETTELKPPEQCYQGDPNYGFVLSLQKEGETTSTIVHSDERIPQSRGCPSSYAILGVITNNDSMDPAVVAVIQVNTYGFEGGDGRYIVIPLKKLVP